MFHLLKTHINITLTFRSHPIDVMYHIRNKTHPFGRFEDLDIFCKVGKLHLLVCLQRQISKTKRQHPTILILLCLTAEVHACTTIHDNIHCKISLLLIIFNKKVICPCKHLPIQIPNIIAWSIDSMVFENQAFTQRSRSFLTNKIGGDPFIYDQVKSI